jgi:predicted RNA-binding protein associated with RNAse of E/G family
MRHPPIIEVKRRLDGSETRFTCDAALVEPGRRAVLIYVIDSPSEVPGVQLRPGMRTLAHFWMDRPYNVYHWLDGGRTIGHYFNIGECSEISNERVAWNDYAVDILVTPGGLTRVLDEDELTPETSPAVRDLVETTRKRILAELPALVREIEAETRRLV